MQGVGGAEDLSAGLNRVELPAVPSLREGCAVAVLLVLVRNPRRSPGLDYGTMVHPPSRGPVLGDRHREARKGRLATSQSTSWPHEITDPDVRLMLKVRDGNAAAFEQLVVRYQDRLITILEHMVGRRELAEDLAQEVFLRVFRARKRYVPGAKFSTWLFTIANNVAANALRSLARRREVHLAAHESGPMGVHPMEQIVQAGSGAIPARQADKAEIRDVVQVAINRLGDRQRMAVLLSKFESLSYAEIGEIMELSPQAIKSLMSRARGNLRDALEPYIAHGKRPEAG